ncbi:MAG: M50 family metallopeptidase [Gemmatimonadales bacterium]|jgi:hypothetical protein
MEEINQRRVRFLAGFAVYFIALWFLWNTPIVYPLKVFVVLLHEISHGIAAVGTGGAIQRIVISPNEGGYCECGGGNAFLTLSAGYLGSLLWGAAILTAARRRGRVPQIATMAIGVLLIAVTVLYVRNLFGVLFGFAFGVGLIVAGRYLPAHITTSLLTALGLTSCLYAILDIKSDILDRPFLESDAHMLAQLTKIPTLFWGILWIVIALLFSAWFFRWSYREATGPADRPGGTFRA